MLCFVNMMLAVSIVSALSSRIPIDCRNGSLSFRQSRGILIDPLGLDYEPVQSDTPSKSGNENDNENDSDNNSNGDGGRDDDGVTSATAHDAQLSKDDARALWDTLGTEHDVAQLQAYPLFRATYCIEIAIALLQNKHNVAILDNNTSANDTGNCPDQDSLQAARCSLAYIKLEVEDYNAALVLAKLVLADSPSVGGGSNLRSLVRNKRIAAARLYGCEASCALGDTGAALKFLTGEKQDDSALDRLSVHLAGVTGEIGRGEGEVSEQAKRRLKRAQRLVRTNASVASSRMNNPDTAKQLAMSAIKIEDNIDSNVLPAAGGGAAVAGRGGVMIPSNASARNALLYGMLCEGNREGTLAVLKSSR